MAMGHTMAMEINSPHEERTMAELKCTDYGIHVERKARPGTEDAGMITMVYTAWEFDTDSSHWTVMTIDDVWFGRIGTGKVHSDLPLLSMERKQSLDSAFDEQYENAYVAIHDCYRGLEKLDCLEAYGEITTRELIVTEQLPLAETEENQKAMDEARDDSVLHDHAVECDLADRAEGDTL